MKMNTQPSNYEKNNKSVVVEDDDDMFPTVLAVPCDRPFILTGKDAENFLREMPTNKMTKEEREKNKRKADKWRKPEKKQYE